MVPISWQRVSRRARRIAGALAVVWTATGGLASASSFVTFESGHVRPLALSPDGSRLFAVNTPDDRLEVFSVTAAGLTHTASIPVGLEPVAVAARTNGEVWVVNHLSDSVSIVDVASTPGHVVRTLLVGDEPRDVVFAGPGGSRAFITTAHRGQNSPIDPQLTTPGVGRADVWVFDATDLGTTLGGTPITIVTLFTDTPRALAASPNGATVYAAGFHTGNQTTTVNAFAVCSGSSAVGPCTIFGATMPGGLPPPDTNFQGITRPQVGLVVRFNGTTGHWEDGLGRDWSAAINFALPDRDVFAIDANANPPVETASFAHVGTVVFDMAVNPVSGTVYVANTEARNEVRFEGPGVFGGSTVRGHLAEARITVLDGGGVHPRHLNKHIDYDVVPSPPGVKDASLATPLGMAVTADGTTLYVAAFGSSKIGVFDTASLEDDTFMPSPFDHIPVTGGGPSGVVLDEPRHRLYAFTRFDNAVSVVDTTTRSEVAHLPVFNPEPASVTAGRRFLYDAVATSSNGEAACASCHIFGDFDSLAWDLGDPDGVVVSPVPNPFRLGGTFGITFDGFHPMKGPMTTQTLRGMANNGPMHWRGDRTGASTGGDALDETLAFKAFNVAFDGLLGRGGPIDTDDMQAFTDFILQVTLPPNPIRALDDSLTADEQAGRNFFFGSASDVFSNCNGCHALNPSLGQFGTDGLMTFEGETQFFKIPHLRNLYQKVGMFGFPHVITVTGSDFGWKGDQVRGFGFLHDGSFDTLFRFHNGLVFSQDSSFFGPNPGGFPNGPAGDLLRRQVERFMLAFDSNLAPIVGQQATLSAASGQDVHDRIDLFLDRAAHAECDVVVKGVLNGRMRGWVRLGSALFRSDFDSEPELTDAELRALATAPGRAFTYTCVPPGSGVRIGIDHDDDGFPDLTELDEDGDPDDPNVTPGGGSPFVLIGTRALKLTDGAAPTSRRVTFKASSSRLDPLALRILPPAYGSSADPSFHGARLIMYNAAGLTLDEAPVDLPAVGWTVLGSVASPTYRYRDRTPGAPISLVTVTRDRIVVKGGAASWGYTLDEPSQGRVALRLSLGTGLRWCADAPAKTSGSPASTTPNDRPNRFVAQAKSPAPSSCPPRP
ncbi:MAG TPA: hypothetical protein VMS22_05110 [Candidatus Eisenbacteria bacterium]|nr:hypothetical protein [Candidatus Eisenbacteria bacterium]